jgi:hypothetical protein
MPRISLIIAVTLTVITGSLLAPVPASAMTLPAPTGLQATLDGTNFTQDVAYVCRHVWRCGPYGCGWRRVCWWTRHYHPYWQY